MADGGAKPVIFISYSHKDEPEKPREDEVAWLSYVQSFLAPAVKHGVFELWVDRHMEGGTPWDQEIEDKLKRCDVFVLLVSRFSMASNYIIDREIRSIRDRQAVGENVHFYPVVLSSTPKAGLDQVNDKNLRPRDAKPLFGFSLPDRDQHMAEIADEIAAITERIASAKAATQPATVRPAAPSFVDIGGLPETGYERLVGRQTELKALDEAWANPKINILSLIAEGGAGKSALVNEWLTRLQADSYRGADAVLGWSFYSQGTKERATSAEGFLNWCLGKLVLALDTTSATAKGEAIAEALARRRVVLVLDGVEPLQHGPSLKGSGPPAGQLKDTGLSALLRRFAAVPPTSRHGLIVLTSRLRVDDIDKWKGGSAPVLDLEHLSDEAGAELLRDNGTWGTDTELRGAARDFGGHPLALTLLATLLKETKQGDVRRRDHIRALLADKANPGHDHAQRVMESYEKEWLSDQPVLSSAMAVMGPFDRPADGASLRALRAPPVIKGLTDAIVGISDEEWQRAVSRLRDARLLAPMDPADPNVIDAHPLVREWFGERLRERNLKAWRTAHGRLYDHLRDSTKEGDEPTLEQLAPLYQAIAHGCRADRHHEAIKDIYLNRIYRRQAGGRLEAYAVDKLGAFGSCLAAVAWFFEKPYETPVAALPKAERAWVVAEAAFYLRAHGRFTEALAGTRAGLKMLEDAADWTNAAIAAVNLSETELSSGNVAAAVSGAARSVEIADLSGQAHVMISARTCQANAQNQAGRPTEAEALFAGAEQRQRNLNGEFVYLYSTRGYEYCDLLLDGRQWVAARDRANVTIAIARQNHWLLDIALDTLTLGRAHLGLALTIVPSKRRPPNGSTDADAARASFAGAIEGLRGAGSADHLPRGLLARAAFRRSLAAWDDAARDLDEVEEIAGRGPMRLFLCDMALEGARLAFARIKAFAPLSGLLKTNPRKPTVPAADEAKRLHDEATANLAKARELIETCGYHRRDEELAELEAVLRGERRFADLPPRV